MGSSCICKALDTHINASTYRLYSLRNTGLFINKSKGDITYLKILWFCGICSRIQLAFFRQMLFWHLNKFNSTFSPPFGFPQATSPSFTWAVYSLTCIAQQGCTFRAREELPCGETLLAIPPSPGEGETCPRASTYCMVWRCSGAPTQHFRKARCARVSEATSKVGQGWWTLNRGVAFGGHLASSQSLLDTISL